MQEKEDMKEVFEKLNDTNKDVMLMVAKGMEIAQNNGNKVVKQTSL